jgi:hypothetical protein
MLLVDETIAFIEENCLEFVFTYYTETLINAMWKIPDYRHGMLEYAGLIKINLKKKLQSINSNPYALSRGTNNNNTMNAAITSSLNAIDQSTQIKQIEKESQQWFTHFFEATLAEEKQLHSLSSSLSSLKGTIVLTTEIAVIKIQTLIRRMIACKRVKKLFAKRYKKYYDELTQAYYYYNVETGESSWNPPKLFQVLYPHMQW